MKTVRLLLVFDDTKDEFKLEATFSDEDLERFKEFIRQSSELKATKIISEGFPKNISLSWSETKGSAVEAEDIDVEYISSFLHKLRPLILDEESSSFRTISALVRKGFKNTGMERQLKKIRYDYENSEFKSYGQITIGNLPVFDDKTLKLWLYSSEYHQDQDKKDLIKHIEDTFTTRGTKTIFVWQLRDKAYAIFKLAELIQYIIDYPNIKAS